VDDASSRVRVHLVLLTAFSIVMFLPMIGHGFVLDDLCCFARWLSIRSGYGLTHAQGAFYTR